MITECFKLWEIYLILGLVFLSGIKFGRMLKEQQK
jgi:hypothetical protein